MQSVSVPWAMWYGKRFEFTFPDTWQVSTAHMRGGPEIGDAGIRRALCIY